jgi:hypothetical protein
VLLGQCLWRQQQQLLVLQLLLWCSWACPFALVWLLLLVPLPLVLLLLLVVLLGLAVAVLLLQLLLLCWQWPCGPFWGLLLAVLALVVVVTPPLPLVPQLLRQVETQQQDLLGFCWHVHACWAQRA